MAIELSAKGTRVVILPEYGGRVHQLFVEREGVEEPLLFSPADVGQYQAQPTRGGMFPMAPWPNRVTDGRFEFRGEEVQLPLEGKPSAIHGLVKNVAWRVVARTARVVELAAEFDSAWPWRGSAWERFEIGENRFRMKMEVRAEREEFPAGCGWHPWFRRDAFGARDVSVTLPANEVYVANNQLPTGEVVTPEGDLDFRTPAVLASKRVDACYRSLSGPIEIDWGVVRLRMGISSPEPHAMLYTPPEAFCVEPQSCAVDAFNLAARGVSSTGMAIAAPGRPVTFESVWVWEF
jgi:aldose 1-epimerase